MALSLCTPAKNFTVDGVDYRHECDECSPECDPFDNPKPTYLKDIECSKNPGHKNFIPIKDFTIDNIKDCANPEHLYKRMLAQSSLVVRIVGHFVSEGRPDDEQYLFSDKRGKSAHYFGTGIITECFCRYGDGQIDACVLCKLFNDRYQQRMPCPCSVCQSSGEPFSDWYVIPIITAKHVIYDNTEARKATVNVFFDDPVNREGVVTLNGICCKVSSDEDDACVLLAITHKKAEFERINGNRILKNDLKAQAKKEQLQGYDRFHYILSFPHGCSMHIAIDFKENLSKRNEKSTMYKTSTCSGSSGAFVGWIDSGGGIACCVHRGTALDKDENISTSVIQVLSVLESVQ